MKNERRAEAGAPEDIEASWGVVCLCAAWCGVCRQYEPAFQALQAKFPQARFEWIDVEEQEGLLGEMDVETFPTLLVGRGSQVAFLGPLLPQIMVLERLLASLMGGQAISSSLSAEAQDVWKSVAARWQQ